MARRLTGYALWDALDQQAYRAATKAAHMRADADPVQRAHAYLMDRAAAFWSDLFGAVRDDSPLSRKQQFARDYIASGGGRP